MASKIIRGPAMPEPNADRSVSRTPPVVPDRAAPRVGRPGVVEAEVFGAHQKAKEIVAQAEAQASEILQRAQEERMAVLSKAREDGRQEGIAQATEILLRARQEAAQLVEESEPSLVKLALVVAEKLVGQALDLDPDLILHITAQAIESVRQQREVAIRVHPSDALLLRSARKKLMDLIGRSKDLAIREDPDICRGGCVIETENGTIDAQLKSQIAMLERALLGG